MSGNVIEQTVSVPVASPRTQAQEILAGYVLQEPLGTGSYGEVWRAVGPGGLQKAVKILFGTHDGPVADAELKSLEHVRELRHPFLLSLERIEIVNGRLVIVTELAEMSLEERFAAHQRQGRKGIPRDELLGYLRDAADALDFMSEKHGLQHLDIKPANLLLQGGHVKVADFGLIKDIRQAEQSLVAGYTPLYAPPELLSGRPCDRSDQYSLAVVYQIMLTGTPPFAGRTTAHLAAQHLHSPPDLSGLPACDRAAVARALSKNPLGRFQNCRQLIDQLSLAVPSTKPAGGGRDTGSASARGASSSAGTRPAPAIRKAPAAKITPRPPVSLEAKQPSFRPAVFVSLGGLAGQVLRTLQSRIRSRFGPDAEIPAWRFVALDSEPRPTRSALPTGNDVWQQLELPLRTAGEYRTGSPELLGWLSRRWLFNVPRSGLVEGIRPLGRLAFVDHCDEVRQALKQALVSATSDSARQAATQATGSEFETGAPDVVLLASISGGTGSGAVLDAGYLLQDVLEELKLPATRLVGVLLHATGSREQARLVQRANAVACLEELRHFTTPALGYPGDPACRLPRNGSGPFPHSYVVHLGDELSDDAYGTRIEELAEYLYRGTATPARQFIEICRRPGDQSAQTSALRTFGVGMPTARMRLDLGDRPDRLCGETLLRWIGEPANAAETASAAADARSWAANLLAQTKLKSSALLALATSLLDKDAQQQANTVLKRRIEQYGRDAACALVASIDADFAAPAAADASEPIVVLRAQIHAQIDAMGARLAEIFGTRLLEYGDNSAQRLLAVHEAVHELLLELTKLGRELATLPQTMEQERLALAQKLSPPAASARGAAAPRRLDDLFAGLQRYTMLRFCLGMYEQLAECVGQIQAAVGATSELVLRCRQAIHKLQRQFTPAGSSNPAAAPGDLTSLGVSFDESLRSQQRLRPSSLSEISEADLARFGEALRGEAVEFLMSHVPAQPGADNPTQTKQPDATPLLLDAAAGCRALAVLPSEDAVGRWQRSLETRLGLCVTPLVDSDERMFLCCEADGLSLDAVIAHLAGDDPAIAETARRLHTRTDVEW